MYDLLQPGFGHLNGLLSGWWLDDEEEPAAVAVEGNDDGGGVRLDGAIEVDDPVFEVDDDEDGCRGSVPFGSADVDVRA